MENIFYLIYIHSNCIEGISLNKNNNNVNISQDLFNFYKINNGESVNKIETDSNFWAKHLETFLDQQKWRDHPIAFILPSEDIIFRKIKFPFQDKKKVEQALPFELEEELIIDLSECSYSTKVQTLTEQKSEALVLLIERKRLKELQEICLDRDLLIKNVDSSAYALFRSKIFSNSSQNKSNDIFQIYLGSDEAFVNTIKDGHLDEIKIFPNRISEILQKHFIKNDTSLLLFLKKFSKDPDTREHPESDSKYAETFSQLKEELKWLCSQLNLHLRIKNFKPENKIETYGVFGPIIKWDGVIFRKRPFPLPEADTFADRCKNNSIINDSSEIKLNGDGSGYQEKKEHPPNTLQELMEEAKQREESKVEPFLTSHEPDINSSEVNLENLTKESSLEAVNPQTSILSMLERKHWGILGDLRKNSEIFLESHFLSLYHEGTPWRIFLRKNKVTATLAASFFLIIAISFVFEKITKLELLKEEVVRAEFLVKSETKRALPKTSSTKVGQILSELREKINNRKLAIQTSKKFEKREYNNLHFLKNISMILDKDASFQVDSIELAPERFTISGTIDSYDRLQIFKKKLEEMDEFYGKRILESNRKSPDGIIYRILIELK